MNLNYFLKKTLNLIKFNNKKLKYIKSWTKKNTYTHMSTQIHEVLKFYFMSFHILKLLYNIIVIINCHYLLLMWVGVTILFY